jgi:hypothetical protein
VQKLFHALTTLVVVFPAFACMTLAGELRFAEENIDVTLYPPDTVEVTGEYFFTSSDGMACNQRVIYPLPADSSTEFPYYISVGKSGDRQKFSFSRIESGISFMIEAPKRDTIAITVTYRQRFGGKTGRYILTTTSYWNRPLSNSRYTIHVPENATLSYLSYECDTVYTSGTYRIYSFFKKKFLPDRDLVFKW